MATILVTGGKGLIGSHLCPRLQAKGYEINLLSRRKSSSDIFHTFFWDPERGEIEDEAIESADYIIHLAGENIGDKRWSSKQKRLILESRISTADLLFDKVKQKGKKIKAFISSSAVGYYGSASSDRIFHESDPPGNDFLSQVCAEWEKAADQFQEIGIRTVKLRSGVVLTSAGGVLAQMKAPVVLGIGSPLGNGKQYVPWIHVEDLCSIYRKAIEDHNVNGPYNVVAPDYITNAEFMRLIAKILKKPFIPLPVPGILLKLLLGERASIVTKGNKVSGERISEEGYHFKFPDLENALKDLI